MALCRKCSIRKVSNTSLEMAPLAWFLYKLATVSQYVTAMHWLTEEGTEADRRCGVAPLHHFSLHVLLDDQTETLLRVQNCLPTKQKTVCTMMASRWKDDHRHCTHCPNLFTT